jgi:uncharacterized protein (DUF2384 family)
MGSGAWNFELIALRKMLAGSRPGGRTTFFASPKKVVKERRPRSAAPFGGTQFCDAKNGKCPKLASLKHGHFFIHFRHRKIGSATAERRKAMDQTLTLIAT